MPVIRCPRCKSLNTKLADGARSRKGKYVRYRKCDDCDFSFTTIEEYSKIKEKDLKDIGDEPNYDILFRSAVESLRIAHSKYKKLIQDFYRWIIVDEDGNFAILDGYEERASDISEVYQEVVRLKNLVEELREKCNP